MEKVNQLIYGNEVVLPLTSVKNGDLYYVNHLDKIAVYKKTKRGKALIKIVDNYGELSGIKNINLEPRLANCLFLNS